MCTSSDASSRSDFPVVLHAKRITRIFFRPFSAPAQPERVRLCSRPDETVAFGNPIRRFSKAGDLRQGVCCCGACARADRRSDDAAGAARSGPFSLPRKSGCSPQACGPVFCVGVRLRKVGAPWAAGRMCGGRIGTRPARFVVFLCRGTGRRFHRAVGGPFAGRLREGRGEYIRDRCRIRLRLSFGLLRSRGGAAVRKHGFRSRDCSVCRAVCSRGACIVAAGRCTHEKGGSAFRRSPSLCVECPQICRRPAGMRSSTAECACCVCRTPFGCRPSELKTASGCGLICGSPWLRCTRWRAAPSSAVPSESACRWFCRCRRSCSRCVRAPFRGCG